MDLLIPLNCTPKIINLANFMSYIFYYNGKITKLTHPTSKPLLFLFLSFGTFFHRNQSHSSRPHCVQFFAHNVTFAEFLATVSGMTPCTLLDHSLSRVCSISFTALSTLNPNPTGFQKYTLLGQSCKRTGGRSAPCLGSNPEAPVVRTDRLLLGVKDCLLTVQIGSYGETLLLLE
jgi:hypothetical protein